VGAHCHGERDQGEGDEGRNCLSFQPSVVNDSAMEELRFNEKGYHYYHGLKLHEDEGYFQFQDFR